MSEPAIPFWRRWWVQAAAAGIAAVIAWVTQVELAGQLSAFVHYALLIFGALSALLAVLLPLRFGRSQEIMRISAQRTAEVAVKEYRLRTSDIFTPMARLVGEIAASAATVKVALRAQLVQMAVDLPLRLRGEATPELRACFFAYNPGPPKNFVCNIHAGRADGPRDDFGENTDRGRAVLRLISEKKTRLVPDTKKEFVEGLNPESVDYRAFICAPVVVADVVHGLLTLDCPTPDSLDDNDRRELQLVAMLLAAGLSA